MIEATVMINYGTIYFISKLNEEFNRYHLMESGIKFNGRSNYVH